MPIAGRLNVINQSLNVWELVQAVPPSHLLGRKEKRDTAFVDGNSRKRSRSIESRSDMADVNFTVDAEKHVPDTTGCHSIEEA